MNSVMRSRGWELRKKSWSCKSKRQILKQLTSSVLPLHCQLHLQHKGKLLATSWCLSLVILALPCGSSCHLQQSTYPRITCSVHRLLKGEDNWLGSFTCAVVINYGLYMFMFCFNRVFGFQLLKKLLVVWRLADHVTLLTLYKIKASVYIISLCFLISVKIHKFELIFTQDQDSFTSK